MRNLFKFIIRYNFFFLFLILQTISIFLIVQNHHYQRYFFVNTSNIIAGNIYSLRSHIVSYFSLARENENLAKVNSMLFRHMLETYLKTDQNVFIHQDTLYQLQYSFINAQVINNSVRNRNNYITLNKGALHGIKPDMGIITHNGVIGIITEVSTNFSSAMSLLHSDIKISARIKRNNHMGTVIWEGNNYRNATMMYIPAHLQLIKGDTVITSGFSHIFPAGVIIGTISDFEIRGGDNFFTITLDLACDFNSLNNVQVVKNLFRDEKMELEALSQAIAN